jgi:hypothetical protein
MRIVLTIVAVGLGLHLAGKAINALAYYGPKK